MVPPVSNPVADAPVVAVEEAARTTLSLKGKTVPAAGRLAAKFGVAAEASGRLLPCRLASGSAETVEGGGGSGLAIRTTVLVALEVAGAPPPPEQAASNRAHEANSAETKRLLISASSFYLAPKLPIQAFPPPEACHTPAVSCAAEP